MPMSASDAAKKYAAFIAARSKLDKKQQKDIEETITVLAQEIIDQVKKATITATDGNSNTVTFVSIE